MTHKATIVCKLPNQLVPLDYLQSVLAENKSGFGFAGREGDKLVIEATQAIRLNEVDELQKSFKNEHLVMYFSDGGVVPDDVMPYTVTNGKDDDECVHHLAMFYEGDFEKYVGMDGEHADVYNVFDTEIAPKISQLFMENDKDWTKTFDAMRSEKFHRTLGNYFNNRGVFVILPPTGDPISFGKNDRGDQYPWGNVSNTHGYIVKAEKKEEDGGGLSFLRGKTKSSGSGAPAPATTTPAKTEPTAPTPEEKSPSEAKPVIQIDRKKGEDIETQVVNGVTLTKMRPPPAIRGNKKANNAWLRCFNNGKLDEDTQRNQFVWVPADLMPFAQRLVSNKEQIEKMGTEISKLKRPAVTTATQTASAAAEIMTKKDDKPITNGKSTVRETVAEAAEKNKPVSDYLPILSDAQREKALEKMAAFTSKGKQLTGIELQKMEARWPTFSKDIGVDFEKDLLARPIDDLVDLFDGNKIAACAYIEMRGEVYRLRSLLDAAKVSYKPEPVKEPEKTEPKKEEGSGLSFLLGKTKKTA